MIKDKLSTYKRLVAIAVSGGLLGAVMFSSVASGEVSCEGCKPRWYLTTQSLPSILVPGEQGELMTTAENLGTAALHGSGVVVVYKLPPGLTAEGTEVGRGEFSLIGNYEGYCSVEPSEVTCTFSQESIEEYQDFPYYNLNVGVKFKVNAGATTGEVAEVQVSGGGATAASLKKPITVGNGPTPFGIEQYEMRAENADGSTDTQAGSHPFQLTTTIHLNQNFSPFKPPAAVKDLRINLPPGLIGNPTPFPRCSLVKFLGSAGEGQNFCPDDTVVGVASVTHTFPVFGALSSNSIPLYSLDPSRGEPARFGFIDKNVPIVLNTSVRTGSDYGITVTVPNITEIVGFMSSRVTFWGVPGDPRHDAARGWHCLQPKGGQPPCGPTEEVNPPPLLTLPTNCQGPVRTTVDTDSWEQAGSFTPPTGYNFKDNIGRTVGMDGCNQLPFTPSIKVTPDGQAGSTPTGLTVDQHVPQDVSLNATGLAESAVKGLTVTLPKGVVLNPSSADGLESCSMEQIALRSRAVAQCPNASKVATVKIKTPLLPDPLEGAAYLAAQAANPFGSLVAMYIYVEDPVSGVRVKAAGEVVPDPVTGQLVAHFEKDPYFAGNENEESLPQLAFEDLELHFFGGDRAPLGTPAQCGTYTTTASFKPWSGNAPVESSSEFQIVSGPNGKPCANPLPFEPTLTGGTTSIQAGGFSPFVTTFSREDGNQNLQSLTLKMPPGLLGTLSTVKLCGEAQANAGACGQDSLIGHTTVSVGLGGDPYSVTGGQVFITGPYKGAPYGLSIVTPAKAGPFDLGTVVVRAKIEVDKSTAALTITTDDSGPYKIPTILDGIPLQIKHINVSIDRPGFIFNPTNCSPQAITGTLNSAEGSSKALSVPMQVTNCAVLAFKPKLTASTSGKPTRKTGASLSVKLTYPAGAYDANIAKVKVDLPKQLPSRLTTLQKACTAAQFEANPAGCPAASIVGHAKATTPVLPVPLEGPAYFVSHGGEQFPSLIVVLQGYGVTVDLVGSTFISKAGITSSTFKTVPDVPVGTFELNLPQGPFSALAAYGNICREKLAMPTSFVGQNGATIKTTTAIKTTGCAKAKKHAHKAKKAAKRHRKNKK